MGSSDDRARRVSNLIPNGKALWVPIDHGVSSWPVQGLLRHFRKEIEKRNYAEPLVKKGSNIPYLIDQHLLEKDNA